MSANPLPQLTAEIYLAMDRAAEWKSEFHDGEIVPLETGSLRHARIVTNGILAIGPRLRVNGCEILASPLRVRVSPSQFVYPDLFIVCGKPELSDEHADTVTNPKVVIEILSPATADYDHGAKFELYRCHPTIEEYLLISATEPKAEVFTKRSENSWWITYIDRLETSVRLQSLGIEIPLAEFFDGVDGES